MQQLAGLTVQLLRRIRDILNRAHLAAAYFYTLKLNCIARCYSGARSSLKKDLEIGISMMPAKAKAIKDTCRLKAWAR